MSKEKNNADSRGGEMKDSQGGYSSGKKAKEQVGQKADHWRRRG